MRSTSGIHQGPKAQPVMARPERQRQVVIKLAASDKAFKRES